MKDLEVSGSMFFFSDLEYGNSKHNDDEAMTRISIIKIRDHVCRVMQSLVKTFVSPEIVLDQTELPAQDRPVGSLLEPGLFLQRQDPTFERRSKASRIP